MKQSVNKKLANLKLSIFAGVRSRLNAISFYFDLMHIVI